MLQKETKIDFPQNCVPEIKVNAENWHKKIVRSKIYVLHNIKFTVSNYILWLSHWYSSTVRCRLEPMNDAFRLGDITCVGRTYTSSESNLYMILLFLLNLLIFFQNSLPKYREFLSLYDDY